MGVRGKGRWRICWPHTMADEEVAEGKISVCVTGRRKRDPEMMRCLVEDVIRGDAEKEDEDRKNKGNLRTTRTKEQVKNGRDFYVTKCQVEEVINNTRK